jgi:hypothetical protein
MVVALPAVVNQQIAIPLKDFPELMKVGGSIVSKAGGTRTRSSSRRSTTACSRRSMRYPHELHSRLQRPQPTPNCLNLTLNCPCHGSTWEGHGAMIDGSHLGR